MLVSEMRSKLEAVIAASQLSSNEQQKIKAFLSALAELDSLTLKAAAKMFNLAPLSKKTTKPTVVVHHPVSERLRSVMQDDGSFEQVLDRIEADKKMTKPILLGVYETLFETLDGVPSKISRADLIQLIRRERVKSVRNKNVHEHLGGQRRPS